MLRILSVATVAASLGFCIVLAAGPRIGLSRETSVRFVLAMAGVVLTSMLVMIGHAFRQDGTSREDKFAAAAQALWLGPVASIPYLWRAGTNSIAARPSRAVRISVGVLAALVWVWLSASFIPLEKIHAIGDRVLAGALPVVGLAAVALTLALPMGASQVDSVLATLPAAILVVVLFQPQTTLGILVASASVMCAALVARLGVFVRHGSRRPM